MAGHVVVSHPHAIAWLEALPHGDLAAASESNGPIVFLKKLHVNRFDLR